MNKCNDSSMPCRTVHHLSYVLYGIWHQNSDDT